MMPPGERRKSGFFRILMVDDDADILKLVSMQIRQHWNGVQVESAPCGRDALHALQQREFDIVLTDLQMPEMDGHEFAQALRRLPEPTCSIPVISMSGTEIPLSKVYASGIDAHLRKPFSLDDLNFLITAVTGNPAFIGGS